MFLTQRGEGRRKGACNSLVLTYYTDHVTGLKQPYIGRVPRQCMPVTSSCTLTAVSAQCRLCSHSDIRCVAHSLRMCCAVRYQACYQ